ncbi:MAG: phosphatidylserine decarboxylase [Actinomycetota bacterium]|nr:phosphatidylserine decarboxylase [Actinomycetota bacterium]
MTWRGLREARRYLVGVVALEALLLATGFRAAARALLAAAAPALLCFRDPERRLDPEEDIVYAVADGVVTGIDAVVDPWLEGGEATRVSTFLALYDVHVTRSPVPGRIALEEELPGGFRAAFRPAAEENRRRRIAIDGPRGRVVVTQVAGMVARRVAPWVGLGQEVTAGQRLAMIHFGSRVDVVLPADNAEVCVSVGERVRAGMSPLARYRAVEDELDRRDPVFGTRGEEVAA